MTPSIRALVVFIGVGLVYLIVGFTQSWALAVTILNDGLIVAIMALGVNMQWGYAGLFNVGVAGFFGLGGLALVLITNPPAPGAWAAGTPRILGSLLFGAVVIWGALRLYRAMEPGRKRALSMGALLLVGLILFRMGYDPAVNSVEAVTPASTGNIGGLGLPIPVSWLLGGVLAAGAAWAIAKTALGLRSDYLAIATLGIGQIVIAVLMNEDWLDRGVKNIINIGRWPVPHEVNLQKQQWFIHLAQSWGIDVRTASTVFVGICFAVVFTCILLVLLTLAELSLKSPWGRMMRAIRDNEIAAEAMGKDVKRRHLQVFVLGSAVIGIAGALYVMLHGLMAPQSYNDPLRYTFLIWAMVILGGSGNNWGSVAGALIVMLLWDEAESVGPAILGFLTSPLPAGLIKQHLIDNAVQMRLPVVGAVLLLVLRFSPKGLIPEK
ncbi:branched-chain amino acid ABC transporter permease [Solirhodobacter olei]|uniref:branched-chain amino acid ABC transporter permease n=1 Tax=Solirhodobacter olei TaxID=2493082 RepID=UPI000FD6F279|nr:branched-chain amino acid ABC transporter permease [Solirhodobacter olei]